MPELTCMPARATAGATLRYRRSHPDYPADQGWTLTVHLRGVSAGNAAVVADGADHVVTFSAAVMAELAAGLYQWLERYTDGTDVFDVWGEIEVLPNIATAAAGALQTHEERILAALKAKAEGRLTSDQETVQVDGMAIARIPYDQLEKLINRYQAKVNQQRAAAAGRAVTTVPIRFGRPG